MKLLERQGVAGAVEKYITYVVEGTVLQYMGRMLRSPEDRMIVLSPDVRLIDVLGKLSTTGIDTTLRDPKDQTPIRANIYVAESPTDKIDDKALKKFTKNEWYKAKKSNWLSYYFPTQQ